MKVRDILGNYSQWMPGRGTGETPLVSVLLPTFRRAKCGLFEAAVQSVLNQDFKSLELIIIDDASTDGTADLIAHFMKADPRVSCIRHQRNVGLPAISEYEGYMKARGEYIAFIFDDNEWERDYVSKTISFMVREHAKAAYGVVRSYSGNAEQYVELGKSINSYGLHTINFTNHIANGGVILHRDVIESIGLYDPHVTQTRLCDWNLWKRICRCYEFYETGIFSGTEKGVTLSDSLGNTYKMNSWSVVEREATTGTDELLPANYLDVEVNAIRDENTDSFAGYLNDVYQSFSSKAWYQPEKNVRPVTTRQGSRLLVLTNAFDATLELAFSRMTNNNHALYFKFSTCGVPIYEIIQADAVIIARDLVALNHYNEVCQKLGIPCFYYTDDNMLLLDDPGAQSLASYWRANNLSKFTGILTSTPALKDFFIQNHLSQNVAVLEPMLRYCAPLNAAHRGEEVTLAYMGGPFRDGVFLHDVMPALVSLAKRQPVRLVCPERLNLKQFDTVPGLCIIQIPFSLSLELTLHRYRKYSPSFLLHCGPDIENNRYKTENALLNALSLGTVLITSKTEQYDESAKAGRLVCATNTAECWFETLVELIENPDQAKYIFQTAQSYCTTRYMPDQAASVLKQFCCPKEETSPCQMIERYNSVLYDMLYSAHASRGLSFGKPSRSLTDAPLIFTGGIQGKRTYYFVCNKPTLNELGICFASLGNPHGQVRIEIRSKDGASRECVLNYDEYVRDNWTYLTFAPIAGVQNKVFTVTLRFEYQRGSAQVGVFEDGKKRSFLFRAFNKLGYRLPIKDLLYVDCR